MYPWEHLTQEAGLEFFYKLPYAMDPDILLEEYEEIDKRFKFLVHSRVNPYYCSGWEDICLVAPFGDPHNVLPLSSYIAKDAPRLDSDYQATELVKYAPHTMEWIKSTFPWRVKRVRYSRLLSGGYLPLHHDYAAGYYGITMRCHVNITGWKGNRQKICHQMHSDMRPGELWYGEYSFPHTAWNVSEIPRVHLLLDFYAEDVRERTPDTLPSVYHEQKEARDRVRPAVLEMMTPYCHLPKADDSGD